MSDDFFRRHDRFQGLADVALRGNMNCSQCGVEKRETNHWFMCWTEWSGKRLCVIPWELDPEMSREDSVLKICGQGCLVKVVQQYADAKQLTEIGQ